MSTLSRRQILKLALASGALASASADAITGSWSLGEARVETVSIHSQRLPKGLSAFRIAFIADLHFGVWTPHEWLERVLSQIIESKPDIVVLGGDYLLVPELSIWEHFGANRNKIFATTSRRELPHKIFSELGGLLTQITKRYPTFAVLGNHDRWLAYNHAEAALSASGVEVLTNRVVKINLGAGPITIIGTDDYLTGIPRLPNAPDDGSFRLLVTHNPDMASAALKHGYQFDLALCGHTHGGQIKSGLLGAIAYNITDLRFREGLVSVGNSYVYTTRGVGMVAVPVRLNCPAEVTIIELQQT